MNNHTANHHGNFGDGDTFEATSEFRHYRGIDWLLTPLRGTNEDGDDLPIRYVLSWTPTGYGASRTGGSIRFSEHQEIPHIHKDLIPYHCGCEVLWFLELEGFADASEALIAILGWPRYSIEAEARGHDVRRMRRRPNHERHTAIYKKYPRWTEAPKPNRFFGRVPVEQHDDPESEIARRNEGPEADYAALEDRTFGRLFTPSR